MNGDVTTAALAHELAVTQGYVQEIVLRQTGTAGVDVLSHAQAQAVRAEVHDANAEFHRFERLGERLAAEFAPAPLARSLGEEPPNNTESALARQLGISLAELQTIALRLTGRRHITSDAEAQAVRAEVWADPPQDEVDADAMLDLDAEAVDADEDVARSMLATLTAAFGKHPAFRPSLARAIQIVTERGPYPEQPAAPLARIDEVFPSLLNPPRESGSMSTADALRTALDALDTYDVDDELGATIRRAALRIEQVLAQRYDGLGRTSHDGKLTTLADIVIDG